MRERGAGFETGVVARAARVAFAFVVLNCSAVAGLFAFAFGRKVWR